MTKRCLVTAMTDETIRCARCGFDEPRPKDWTRRSIWKRENRRCRACASIKHGGSRTKLYRVRMSMLVRCGHRKVTSPALLAYYVNKGIKVCDEWQHSYAAFETWALENGYKEGLTIDRIDGDLGYSPENCRWVTMAENLRNRKCVKITPADALMIRDALRLGEKAADLAARYGVTRGYIYQIKSGARHV